jgi:multisubunit Na+/H+ antiporter MnhF subunit
MALAEGLHRQPFIDLALVLALLSFVGGVTFARFMESHV